MQGFRTLGIHRAMAAREGGLRFQGCPKLRVEGPLQCSESSGSRSAIGAWDLEFSGGGRRSIGLRLVESRIWGL